MNDLSPLIEKIRIKSKEILSEVISIRQTIHSNPELSFEEFATSKLVCKKLEEYGIEYKKGWVKTGIVGLIKGQNPGKKTIALRSELDALPIQENNNTKYQSKNIGVMHACGHDAHTACLLGVGKIFSQLKEEFEGTLMLIFQPGEEKLPGGASLMLKEGVFNEILPSKIIAQHVTPQIECGKVGFRSGMYMASADEIYITVYGKGGHAALPGFYNNPLIIASKILLALNEEFMTDKILAHQKIGSNQELIPTVLAFGKIIGNGATNVIPDKVSIEGTFRTLDENWRLRAHQIMKNTANEIAQSMSGTCDFNIMLGYPFLVNDPHTTENAKELAQKYLGKENVEALDMRMTSEDFAFFSQKIPACFYRLGTGNRGKNITSNVHTSTFDIDEKSLEIGVGLMACIALQELQKND